LILKTKKKNRLQPLNLETQMVEWFKMVARDDFWFGFPAITPVASNGFSNPLRFWKVFENNIQNYVLDLTEIKDGGIF
jgi:hypothetical protein